MKGDGEMALVVKSLPHKHKELESPVPTEKSGERGGMYQQLKCVLWRDGGAGYIIGSS